MNTNDHARGQIKPYYTVWCGECFEWEDVSDKLYGKSPTQNARLQGWKYTQKYGWLCSKCQEEKP